MDASSRVSPFRQRMIDDMRVRKLSEKTQSHYLPWGHRLAAASCFNRSPASRFPIPRSAASLPSCSPRGRATSCSQL